MAYIGAAYNNVTAAGTLTVSDENTSYPKANLYDYDIGKPMKFNSTTTPRITVGPVTADILCIPAGHNLTGMKLRFEKNSSASWPGTLIESITPSDNSQIVSKFDSYTGYFSVLFEDAGGGDPASIPEISEFFLSTLYTFERDASRRGSGPFGTVRQVEDLVRADGAYRALKYGNALRRRQYQVRGSAAQLTNFTALQSATWDEGLPFLLHDHEAAYIWSRMISDPSPKPVSASLTTFGFDCIEVVG